MKKIYYLTKGIITLPCLGLLPVGVYLTAVNLLNHDFGGGVFMVALTAIYVWLVTVFCSPAVNPAFIASAENPQKFFWVNFWIMATFLLVLLTLGTCLWPILHWLFLWLGNDLLNVQMSGEDIFLWVYSWANIFFHLAYLALWEYVRKQRVVYRLARHNACW